MCKRAECGRRGAGSENCSACGSLNSVERVVLEPQFQQRKGVVLVCGVEDGEGVVMTCASSPWRLS